MTKKQKRQQNLDAQIERVQRSLGDIGRALSIARTALSIDDFAMADEQLTDAGFGLEDALEDVERIAEKALNLRDESLAPEQP